MKSFTEVLEEAAGKGLTVFDIDDTLFRTAAKVKVRNKKTGDVKELPPVQFNKYKLKKDEEWDFGEFKSAKIFQQTAMPIGRMGTADEVAGAIYFFASPDSSLCQGSVLSVDGGFTAQ